MSVHKLIMLENKASGCSHAVYSERLFAVNASKIKSVFQTSFFQGYTETNAILFPLRMLVSAGIYLWPDEGRLL